MPVPATEHDSCRNMLCQMSHSLMSSTHQSYDKRKMLCMLLPNVTKPSITDFTSFVAISFSCHLCNLTNCCYNQLLPSRNQLSFELLQELLHHPICPHHCRQGMRHSSTRCTMSYNCGEKVFVMSFPAHIYRSTLSLTIRAETWVYILEKVYQHEEKVILPFFYSIQQKWLIKCIIQLIRKHQFFLHLFNHFQIKQGFFWVAQGGRRLFTVTPECLVSEDN